MQTPPEAACCAPQTGHIRGYQPSSCCESGPNQLKVIHCTPCEHVHKKGAFSSACLPTPRSLGAALHQQEEVERKHYKGNGALALQREPQLALKIKKKEMCRLVAQSSRWFHIECRSCMEFLPSRGRWLCLAWAASTPTVGLLLLLVHFAPAFPRLTRPWGTSSQAWKKQARRREWVSQWGQDGGWYTVQADSLLQARAVEGYSPDTMELKGGNVLLVGQTASPAPAEGRRSLRETRPAQLVSGLQPRLIWDGQLPGDVQVPAIRRRDGGLQWHRAFRASKHVDVH